MDDQHILHMDEDDPPKEDARFTIHFQINSHEPISISDLKISEYLKFKRNDEYALQYCQNYHTDENEVIENMYRSLDDVDYTRVKIPDIDMEGKCTEGLTEIESKDASQASCSSSSQKSKCKIQPSPIWSHVEKVKNKDVYKCIYCKKEYRACGNTTNMLKHLKTQHPLFFQMPPKSTNSSNTKIKEAAVKRPLQEVDNIELTLSPPKKQCADSSGSYGIKEAFKHIDSFKEGGSMSDKITNVILFMICKDLLPISTVEHESFLTLLKVLAPLYKPPSNKTMTKKLESRYDVMKQGFVKELQDADCYCLTCDNWTDCSNKSYLGVTIHYLQKSFKMKSGCLGCFPLHERHTAEYLKQSLQQLLEEFNITTEKLTAIVSDGEAAIKKACTEIVGKDKHIVCIAHVVAHVVAHLLPDALTKFPELTSIIDQVKSIVTLIKRSIPASDKLRELQLKAGKSEGTVLSLIQDVPTRWTTKVDAIERYLELEQYVYVAMSDCANPVDVLSREEIKILKDVFPIMEPIRDVIREISGDSYPTCSFIIPIVHCMKIK
ncbi:E3 SUMO-protein ligase ZBED1-like [Solenopsis invicta]|uniref:E3 SUMO-protein ligase ZBED1-like n=1 Tax=Solenopsis invicta TaxID=13686 RepID=UPI00193D597B|nr:E3 SUMO-protein ligase ZBED1-like [Solenopsis invicta]